MAIWNYNGVLLPKLPSSLTEEYTKLIICCTSYQEVVLLAIPEETTYEFYVDNVDSLGQTYSDLCIKFNTTNYKVFYQDNVGRNIWRDITMEVEYCGFKMAFGDIRVADIIWSNFDIVVDSRPIKNNLRINGSECPDGISNYNGYLLPDLPAMPAQYCIGVIGEGVHTMYYLFALYEGRFYYDASNDILNADSGYCNIYMFNCTNWIHSFHVDISEDNINFNGQVVWSSVNIPIGSTDGQTILLYASEPTKTAPEGRIMPFEIYLPELPDGLLDEYPNVVIGADNGDIIMSAFSSDAVIKNCGIWFEISCQHAVGYILNNETNEWDFLEQVENDSIGYRLGQPICLFTFDIIPEDDFVGMPYIETSNIGTNVDVVYNYNTWFPKIPESFEETYPYIVILWDPQLKRYELLGCKYAWTYNNSDSANTYLTHTSATNSVCSYRWNIFDSDYWDDANIGSYAVYLYDYKNVVWSNHDIKYTSNSSTIYHRLDTNGLYPFRYALSPYDVAAQKDQLIVILGAFREEADLSESFNISYISHIFGSNDSNQYITTGYRKMEEDTILRVANLINNVSGLRYTIVLVFDDFEAIKTLENSVITSVNTSSKEVNVPNKANDGIVIWVGSNNYSGEDRDLITTPNDLMRVGLRPYNAPRLFAYVDMGDGALERTFKFTSYGNGSGIILAPIVVVKDMEYTEYGTWYVAMANEIRRLTNSSDELTTEEMLTALKNL